MTAVQFQTTSNTCQSWTRIRIRPQYLHQDQSVLEDERPPKRPDGITAYASFHLYPYLDPKAHPYPTRTLRRNHPLPNATDLSLHHPRHLQLISLQTLVHLVPAVASKLKRPSICSTNSRGTR